ncbi:MAG TPA: hypothetical protein VF015_09310 [Acidimicrobiales bacterium]
MSSAEDVQPEATTAHPDERLARAFDRAERLGIDLDAPAGVREHDELSERAAAAVRAFTALTADPAVGGPVDPDVRPADPPPAADPSGLVGPPGFHEPTGFVEPPGFPEPSASETTTARPASAATVATAAETAGDRVLRPDAVLQGWTLPGDVRDVRSGPAGAPTEAALRGAPAATDRGPAAERDPAAARGPAAAGGSAGRGPASETGAAAATGSPGRRGRPLAPDPEPHARDLDRFLLDLVALAVATGAFVAPWAWTLAVAAGTIAGATLRSVAEHGPQPGALVRRGARRALSWLVPRVAIRFPVVVVRTVVLAMALPAVTAAVWWILDQGADGTFVAARAGVWAHGLRTAAALVCYMLVAGVGEAHQRRADLVGRATAPLTGGTVAGLAAATVVVGALVLAVAPRTDAGWAARQDGLGWVPARLRDNVDRVRDDLVVAELHATVGCLSDHQGTAWQVTYTAGNSLEAPDVARLSVADGVAAAPGPLATAVAAVHNQLAPWVEHIEVVAAGSTVVWVDRGPVPSGRPLVEPTALVTAASAGGDLLAAGAPDFDRPVALACSAAPLP